jgi:hypothetical protein
VRNNVKAKSGFGAVYELVTAIAAQLRCHEQPNEQMRKLKQIDT